MLRRFYVRELRVDDTTCVISGSEARHISKVLRMRPGDRFILMDGKGARFRAVIEAVSSRDVSARLEMRMPDPSPSPVTIIVCQAVLKSRSMDYLVQKTSELGVERICLFFSERTVPRFDPERLSKKMRHWEEIAISAAKQCGRAVPVKIDMPGSFGALLKKYRGMDAMKVILWEEERSGSLKMFLRSSPRLPGTFVGIVGPEGGFSREEIRSATDAGFVSACLGERILRAETAAITLAAIVQYELGDFE